MNAQDASTATPRLRTDSLLTSVALLLGFTAVQRGLGLVRSVLVCRTLEPDQLGRWDLAWSFLCLAAPLAVLGLPGSFGRYVEHYRQHGQLRTFLLRVTGVCAALLAVAVAGLACAPGLAGSWVFGGRQATDFWAALCFALAAVAAYNYINSLLAGLRLYRVVSFLQTGSSLLFALFVAGLFAFWRADATAVVLALALSYTVMCLAATPWLRAAADQPADQPLARRALWGRLLPFALWLWATNLLANVFDLVDRWLLVQTTSDSLALLGQYHSARIVPLLLLGVTELLATLVTPHLTADWESGERARMHGRLNLLAQLTAWGLTAAGCATLLAAPLLEGLLGEKFAAGLTLLPATLAIAGWTGLHAVCFNYLWCAERARWGCLTLLAGLLLDFTAAGLLIPAYGLQGAVAGALVGRIVAHGSLLLLCARLGMRWSRGTLLLSLAPALLLLGPVAAGFGLLLIGLELTFGKTLLTVGERTLLRAPLPRWAARLPRGLARTLNLNDPESAPAAR